MRLTVAEILLKVLQEHETTHIFDYPGSCVMPALDSICDSGSGIEFILVRHEQGAIHAAQGYTEVLGKPGVAMVTSGPGATNTVTGIAEAMRSHVPLIILPARYIRICWVRMPFQEVDIIGIT